MFFRLGGAAPETDPAIFHETDLIFRGHGRQVSRDESGKSLSQQPVNEYQLAGLVT